MTVKIGEISNEACDHCEILTTEPVYALKFRTDEAGKVQLWLHKKCFQELLEKIYKLEVKNARAAETK